MQVATKEQQAATWRAEAAGSRQAAQAAFTSTQTAVQDRCNWLAALSGHLTAWLEDQPQTQPPCESPADIRQRHLRQLAPLQAQVEQFRQHPPLEAELLAALDRCAHCPSWLLGSSRACLTDRLPSK